MAGYSEHRYGGVAQLLHWLIAIMIFVLFGLGFYMADLEAADPSKFRLYQIHKGIGVTVFILAVFRLLWRFTHPAPPLPATMKSWERLAATGAHIALYILILLQPIIGILQSNAANFPIVLLGSFELPALIGEDKAVGEMLVDLHHRLAKVLALLILVHIAAAFRHHFMLKDGVLSGMLPRTAVGALTVVLALGILTPFFLPSVVTTTPVVTPAPVASTTPATSETSTTDATPATAQQATTSEPETAPASTGAGGAGWAVEEESMLGFIAKQQGSPVKGQFEIFDAEILFDPDNLTKSRLSIDIDATSISTGHDDRDKMLNSPSFFDTEKWPAASFKSTRIISAGDGLFGALGNLTIRDVTKKVTLPFMLDIKADPEDPSRELAHAIGELPIMRLNYGIGQGDWSSTGTVADEVVITIDIKASRLK